MESGNMARLLMHLSGRTLEQLMGCEIDFPFLYLAGVGVTQELEIFHVDLYFLLSDIYLAVVVTPS
tara:strand:+ start:337 stop:534 length:198 start_codon:yes stop_codon:yes gene_type:complete